MKLNIKEIIEDKPEKNEHWLADAVEGTKTTKREHAERESCRPEENSANEMADAAHESFDDHGNADQVADRIIEMADETCEVSVNADSDAKPWSDIDTEVEQPADADADENVPERTDATADADTGSAIDDSAGSEIIDAEIKTDEADPAIKHDQDSAPKTEPKAKKRRFWKRRGPAIWLILMFAAILGTVVVYTSMIPRHVYAVINDEQREITTTAYTIDELLEEEGISYCVDDYISMPTTTYIHDGIRFEFKHAMDFTVTADGETTECKSIGDTVGQALADCNIEVGEIDIVEPSSDTRLADNMQIVVKRVTIEKKTVTEAIPYKTVKKEDDSLAEGKTKVTQKGKKGKAKVTYKIKYIDGKKVSKKQVSKKVVKKAKKKIIATGTKVSFDGRDYSRKLTVKAYSYTGGGTTAMGTKARVGEIAVDPSVIPLGSNVYIEGVGARRAEDTGGNIKGKTIDIYMNTESECINWGVRYVTIYIE